MNKENLDKIHRYIQRRGDEIQPILPALPGHPYRQAQAHLYKEIKLRFGVPVKEIGDDRFDEVMRLLEICCENAADPDIKIHFILGYNMLVTIFIFLFFCFPVTIGKVEDMGDNCVCPACHKYIISISEFVREEVKRNYKGESYE